MQRIATIGFFDGVHVGHQYVFQQLRKEAESNALYPLIVTFAQHPRQVLHEDYIPELLTTVEERKTLLEQYAETLILDFKQVRKYTAEQFMLFLRDVYHVSTLLMGYDHRFGSDRLSTWEEYAKVGNSCGVEIRKLSQYRPQTLFGEDGLPQHVSSTEIRHMLHMGQVETANALLGYSYTLTGIVVHGRGIGHTIGFPTANIALDNPHKLVPETGVYKAEVFLPSSKYQEAISIPLETKSSVMSVALAGNQVERFMAIENQKLQSYLSTDMSLEATSWLPAIVNIGTNPTVGNKEQTIEVHIPSIDVNLYGATLHVRLIQRIRGERHFPNLEALISQIHKDVAYILE